MRVRVERHPYGIGARSRIGDMKPTPIYPGDFLPVDIKVRVAFPGDVLRACMLRDKTEVLGDDLQIPPRPGVLVNDQIDPRNGSITRNLDGPVVGVMRGLPGYPDPMLGGIPRPLGAEKVAAEKDRHYNQDDDRFFPFIHSGLMGRR